jgi:uncharacterized membrane protein YheB (UPF0754 family)
MDPALLLAPLVSAMLFWLTFKIGLRSLFWPYKPMRIAGVTLYGTIPKNRGTIIQSLARAISDEILQSELLTQKLAGRETLQKALPMIDAHIDHFLNHTIKTAIPAISIFIGDKITAQLKELFLLELEELFPSVMSQFIGNLSHNKELEEQIAVNLNKISAEGMEQRFYKTFAGEIRKTGIKFAVIGLVAGLLQLLITLILV